MTYGPGLTKLVTAAAAGLLLTATPALAAPKRKPATTTPAAASTTTRTNVPHPAPDFAWIGAGNVTHPMKSFRGQPVVILVASSPAAGDLRKQAKRIEDLYLEFAAKKTIFVAAFTGVPGRVQSNVPFVIAQNGAAVASAYGVQGKGLVVIVVGPDGNIDMVSPKVEGAQRILDIINNTYQVQAAARTGLGS